MVVWNFKFSSSCFKVNYKENFQSEPIIDLQNSISNYFKVKFIDLFNLIWNCHNFNVTGIKNSWDTLKIQ